MFIQAAWPVGIAINENITIVKSMAVIVLNFFILLSPNKVMWVKINF